MTMTEQTQKKRRKRNELSPEQEDALAKKLGEVLGADCKVKRPSKQLEAALEALILDWNKLQVKVDTVFTIGRKEEYSDKAIGSMIREKMKEHYSQSTIQRVFEKYPDAKQQQKRKKVVKMNTFNGKCPKCGKLLNEPTSDTDKNRFYKETIETKNKLIGELREEIVGLGALN